jgi:hypothetical protein
MRLAKERGQTMQNLHIDDDVVVVDAVNRRVASRADVGGRYMIRVDPCDGRLPVVCKVLDYSVTGMRLEIPNIADLAGDVQVLIGDIAHRAHIIWRRDNVIGVDFVDEHHDII